jgi:hypothetical protein
MAKTLEDRIVEELNKKGMLDDQDLAHQKSPISYSEFESFTSNIIYKIHGGWKNIKNFKQKGTDFETYIIPWEYNGSKFLLRVMFGQGDSYQLFTEKELESFNEKLQNLKKNI